MLQELIPEEIPLLILPHVVVVAEISVVVPGAMVAVVKAAVEIFKVVVAALKNPASRTHLDRFAKSVKRGIMKSLIAGITMMKIIR
jgi:hypothetical protein